MTQKKNYSPKVAIENVTLAVFLVFELITPAKSIFRSRDTPHFLCSMETFRISENFLLFFLLTQKVLLEFNLLLKTVPTSQL